jgi:3-methyl-2-oxobutanoate hydroxymethyltransferase
MSGYLQGNEMTAGAGAPTPAAVPAPAAPVPATPKAVTVPSLLAMRAAGNKIAMLTCYDASFASLMDRCGVEILLIGDSLGMVCAGHDSTLPVTVADMVYHTASVARGNKHALVLADMPFGAYGNPQQAYDSAVQLMRAGAQMIKIEGGAWLADTVRLLVERRSSCTSWVVSACRARPTPALTASRTMRWRCRRPARR